MNLVGTADWMRIEGRGDLGMLREARLGLTNVMVYVVYICAYTCVL